MTHDIHQKRNRCSWFLVDTSSTSPQNKFRWTNFFPSPSSTSSCGYWLPVCGNWACWWLLRLLGLIWIILCRCTELHSSAISPPLACNNNNNQGRGHDHSKNQSNCLGGLFWIRSKASLASWSAPLLNDCMRTAVATRPPHQQSASNKKGSTSSEGGGGWSYGSPIKRYEFMVAFMRPLLGLAQREIESLLWLLPCKLSSKVEHESIHREGRRIK